MNQKITKKKLIEQLQTERARLETLIGELTNEQMENPGVQGEWSVKDIIAHIAVWERRGIKWLRAVANGKEPQVPEPGYTYRDQKALNLQTYQENRDRPLQDIIEEFQQSFPILMGEVENIAEEQLDTTFQGDWTRNHLITGWHIAAWRFWHYRSHREHIENWIMKQGRGQAII